MKLLFTVSTTFNRRLNLYLTTMQKQHIAHSADCQVRVKWDNRTVSIWDNRVTAHTAISDYDVHNPEEGLRHGFRITTLGEVPIPAGGKA